MSRQSRTDTTDGFPFLLRLRRAYETVRGTSIPVENYQPTEHPPLVEYEVPENCTEKSRYWVNAPFSFVSIYDDKGADEWRYHVVVPQLSAFQTELLEQLRADVRDRLVYTRTDERAGVEETLQTELRTMLEQYGTEVDIKLFYKLFYFLDREFSGYGPIQPLLMDSRIEDISCDGYDMPVFVFHSEHNDIKTNLSFGQQALDDMVIQLGQMSDRQLSVGEPISNATLPNGSRAELVYAEEISPHGSAFTIRQYSTDTMTPVDLIKYGTFSVEQMAYFWLAIENNKNLIFVGGTASGKTTSLNAVSMFIPPTSKIITIEDTREISLAHENWLSNVTRERVSEDTNIGMYALLRSALRHRPEYIIVGEVRGEEALTLFQAMNTGHTTYSTMHADSIQTVINRLENNPINVPRAMIQSLDILSIQRLTNLSGNRVRRSGSVVEVGSIDERSGNLNYSDLYSWNSKTDSFSGSYADSEVLTDIAEARGWSNRELREEFNDRQRILQYLVDNDVNEYGMFTNMVKSYARNPDAVLETIRTGGEFTGAEQAAPTD